jgi:hypothetical protein
MFHLPHPVIFFRPGSKEGGATELFRGPSSPKKQFLSRWNYILMDKPITGPYYFQRGRQVNKKMRGCI